MIVRFPSDSGNLESDTEGAKLVCASSTISTHAHCSSSESSSARREPSKAQGEIREWISALLAALLRHGGLQPRRQQTERLPWVPLPTTVAALVRPRQVRRAKAHSFKALIRISRDLAVVPSDHNQCRPVNASPAWRLINAIAAPASVHAITRTLVLAPILDSIHVRWIVWLSFALSSHRHRGRRARAWRSTRPWRCKPWARTRLGLRPSESTDWLAPTAAEGAPQFHSEYHVACHA